MQSIAIIPAAGHSRRMGQPKLLLPWRGKPIIQHVLDAWGQSHVSRVVIVARQDDRELRKAVSGYEAALVGADPPPPQMKDSIALGLAYAECAYAPGPQDVWLLAPADMPRLSPSIINAVLAQHHSQRPEILVPRVGDKHGHPVLFPWPLAAEVARLGDNEGVNALRERFPWRPFTIEDAAVLEDLDTPEDYHRLNSQPRPPAP